MYKKGKKSINNGIERGKKFKEGKKERMVESDRNERRILTVGGQRLPLAVVHINTKLYCYRPLSHCLCVSKRINPAIDKGTEHSYMKNRCVFCYSNNLRGVAPEFFYSMHLVHNNLPISLTLSTDLQHCIHSFHTLYSYETLIIVFYVSCNPNDQMIEILL